MMDSFMLIERYNWPMSEIEALDWSDYCAIVDGAKSMYERERKAAEAAAKGR
jgi:hypothetical protein